MKVTRREWMVGASANILLAVALASCHAKQTELNIGWQTPLATQGEIVAILQNTDILKEQGLAATFHAFSFGAPQMEAARAGAINVAFVGDQPLINLICAGADWKILCRLFDTRVCLFRNLQRSWSGAKGKTFAAPKGSVAHREAVLYQRSLGLDPDTDVKNVFIDATEIAALLARGGDWGGIDVIAIWEPLASRFKSAPDTVMLYMRKTLGVVGIQGSLAREIANSARLRAVLTAAWQYFLRNEMQAHDWYRQLAGGGLDGAVLQTVARLDRNFADNRPNIILTAADQAELARSIDWANELNPRLKRVNVSDILVAA